MVFGAVGDAPREEDDEGECGDEEDPAQDEHDVAAGGALVVVFQ